MPKWLHWIFNHAILILAAVQIPTPQRGHKICIKNKLNKKIIFWILRIPPNPILFAQFFSEKHTLRIRVNNSNNSALTQQSDNSYFNKRIDIDIFLGGPLYIFLTPSQILLLKNIFSLLLPREKEPQNQPMNSNANNFGGLPMNKEHFNRMMEQIQGEFFEADQRQKFIGQKRGMGGGGGTWSGSEQYFEFSDTPKADYNWRKIIGGQKFRPNSPEMEIMEEKNHSKSKFLI